MAGENVAAVVKTGILLRLSLCLFLLPSSTAAGQTCNQCHDSENFLARSTSVHWGWGDFRGCTARPLLPGHTCMRWDEVEASACEGSSPCPHLGQHCLDGYTCCRVDANSTGSCTTTSCWVPDTEVPEGCARFGFTPADFSDAGLDENYCRKPDASTSEPWCVVAVSSRRYLHGVPSSWDAWKVGQPVHYWSRGIDQYDDVYEKFGNEALGAVGTQILFGNCNGLCTDDSQCAGRLRCSNSISRTPRNGGIPGCVMPSLRSLIELHHNYTNDERLQALAETSVLPPDVSKYASYRGESEFAVVEEAEAVNAKSWAQAYPTPIFVQQLPPLLHSSVRWGNDYSWIVLGEEALVLHSQKVHVVVAGMLRSCIEAKVPDTNYTEPFYPTFLRDHREDCKEHLRYEAEALAPILASEYVFDVFWTYLIQPAFETIEKLMADTAPAATIQEILRIYAPHAPSIPLYPPNPDGHYCYDPAFDDELPLQDQPTTLTASRWYNLATPSPPGCDPCTGAPDQPFSRRGCECGVELHQRRWSPTNAARDEPSVSPSPPAALDVCFINDGIASSYCASTPVASFPYTAWHRSEPSGFVAALTHKPGTKYARVGSMNLGFIEDFGLSLIDTTLGGASSACAEAFREYVCFTLQPQCRFDGDGGVMRACGVCRGVCTRYLEACDPGTIESLRTLAESALTLRGEVEKFGLCNLDIEGFSYDLDFTRQAIRRLFFPNCTHDFEDTHCTSADLSTCPQEPVTPSASFRTFASARNNTIVDEQAMRYPAAELRLSGGVERVATSFGNSSHAVLSIPSGNESGVFLTTGLPASLLSERVDQYTLVGDFYFEPTERYSGESANGPPSGSCERKGNSDWEHAIGTEPKFRRRPSSCILFNQEDQIYDERYCPLLGVLGGCISDDQYTSASLCGVKFSTGLAPRVSDIDETPATIVIDTFFLAQHRIIAAEDTGPDRTWMRIVLSVDLVAGYVRVYANAGEGAGKVMDDSWLQELGVSANNGEPFFTDEDMSTRFVNPGGFLALADSINVASDCNSASMLGSLTLFPTAMSDQQLKVLAGNPFSPSSFMLKVLGSRSLEITEDADGEQSANVTVRLLHPPSKARFHVTLAPVASQGHERLEVSPSSGLTFTRESWRAVQHFNIRVMDDDLVQRKATETFGFRLVPSEPTLWPFGQDDLVHVTVRDDDVAFLRAAFALDNLRGSQGVFNSSDGNTSGIDQQSDIAVAGEQFITHTFTRIEWVREGYTCAKTANEESGDGGTNFIASVSESEPVEYSLVLGSKPDAASVTVKMKISMQNAAEVDVTEVYEVDPSEILFTNTTWGDPQSVTLRYTGAATDQQAKLEHVVQSTDEVYNSLGAGLLPVTIIAVPPPPPPAPSTPPTDGTNETVLVAVGVSLAVVALVALMVLHQYRRRYMKVKVEVTSAKQRASAIRLQKESAESKVLQLKASLDAANKIVKKVLSEGGSLLDPWKLNHAEIVFSDPIEDSILGEGSFGTVYKAMLRGRPVAVKTVRTTRVTEQSVREFTNEIKCMAPLKHPNLVNLLGGCWADGPDKLCLVLEFASHGSLTNLLAKSDRGHSKWSEPYFAIMLGVAKCIRYLHHEQPGQALIHRDIKPDNVLITMDETTRSLMGKVADFGASRRVEDTATTIEEKSLERDSMTIVGTPIYCAPEVMRHEEYSLKVDCYSYAMTLFQVATVCNGEAHTYMRDEFRKHTRGQIPYFVGKCGWRPSIPDALLQRQPKLVRLIKRSWDQNDRARPLFKELVSMLEEIGSEDVHGDSSAVGTELSSSGVVVEGSTFTAESDKQVLLGEISRLNEESMSLKEESATLKKERAAVKEDIVTLNEENAALRQRLAS